MSSSLDMSLDDIIRKKKSSEEHNRHFGDKSAKVSRSGPGPGPDRHAPNRRAIRTRPYPVVPPRSTLVMSGRLTWQDHMMPSGTINGEAEAKLYISNLDYGVSKDDIKLLFSEVGELKEYSINYDRSGRSKGTAEVIFFSQANALAAIERYNNMNLDGKPLKIELVVTVVAPNPVPPTTTRILGRPNDAFRSGHEGGARKWVHTDAHGTGPQGTGTHGTHGTGGGHGSAGFRHKQGNHHGKKLTVEDLDAELEKYHSKAVRIKRFH